jgi:hypothetical protein
MSSGLLRRYQLALGLTLVLALAVSQVLRPSAAS